MLIHQPPANYWLRITVPVLCGALLSSGCRPQAPGTTNAPPPARGVAGPDAALLRQAPVEVETELEIERRQREEQAHRLFRARKYAELEKIASHLRSTKARFVDGTAKLASFYAGVAHMPKETTDAAWEARLQQLVAWVKHDPRSITARVALARACWHGAYRARGTGRISTVTSQMQAIAQQRCELAVTQLKAAADHRDECYMWYVTGQRTARQQGGWRRDKYDSLVDEGLRLFPEYANLHLERAYFLLPRWYGENGEWEQYATDVCDKVGGEAGDILYAQFCWNFQGEAPLRNVFKESTLQWPRVKKGYTALLKRNPKSFAVATAFANAAYQAGDVATMKPLFRQHIRNRCSITYWRTVRQFERARQQALAS